MQAEKGSKGIKGGTLCDTCLLASTSSTGAPRTEQEPSLGMTEGQMLFACIVLLTLRVTTAESRSI